MLILEHVKEERNMQGGRLGRRLLGLDELVEGKLVEQVSMLAQQQSNVIRLARLFNGVYGSSWANHVMTGPGPLGRIEPGMNRAGH
jgi:hypothetical protein